MVLDADYIADTVRNLERLRESLEQLIIDVCRDQQSFILELQRSEQLYQGKRGDGREIRPRYAESTVNKKRRKGQVVDRVTLRDEGVFYASISIDFGLREFRFQSDDAKFKFLANRYGEEVLGLNRDSRLALADRIEQEVKFRILNSIFP